MTRPRQDRKSKIIENLGNHIINCDVLMDIELRDCDSRFKFLRKVIAEGRVAALFLIEGEI